MFDVSLNHPSLQRERAGYGHRVRDASRGLPLRKLLEEYVPRVYRFALRLTNDPHAAEDLTQETFLRAWRQLDRLREPGAMRVWLLRITANLWRDQLRRGRSPVARARPITDNHVGKMPSAEITLAGKEDVNRAREAMASLPDRQRDVLHLNAYEGLSAGEIAEVLGISPEAAKASLSLARKRMRQELSDLFESDTSPNAPAQMD